MNIRRLLSIIIVSVALTLTTPVVDTVFAAGSHGKVIFNDGYTVSFTSLACLTNENEFRYRRRLEVRDEVTVRFSAVSQIEFVDLTSEERAIAEKQYLGIMKKVVIHFRDGSKRENVYMNVAQLKWRSNNEQGDLRDARIVILAE